MARKLRGAFAGFAVAVTMLLVGVVQPAGAAVVTKVWDMNISGSVLNWGQTGVASAVVSSLNNYRPAVVTLQEVCRKQYDHIVNNTSYRGHFEPTLQAHYSRCDGASDFGIAVLSNGNPANNVVETYWLSNEYNGEFFQPKVLLCLRTDIGASTTRVRACSVHLECCNSGMRQKQLDEVAYVVNTQAASGTRVILAGDLNSRPGTLEELSQRFIEADHLDQAPTLENTSCLSVPNPERSSRCNGPLDRKYDHIFYSRNHYVAGTANGSPTSTSWSDHLPLRGTASFN